MWLEDFVGSGATQVVGNPLFLGFVILAFFAGIVFLNGSRLDVKVLGISGAVLLASAFMPAVLLFLLGLCGAVLVYWALMKVIAR